ncbi:MAG: HEAT repeat domain-containing protein [Acidimicrobiia bacterium]
MTFSDDIARARKEPEVALQNVDPRVRCAALASLATRKQLGVHWDEVCHDASWLVRRRACELAAHTNLPPDAALIDLLGDEHPLVTEAAAFALGERECVGAVPALVSIVSHDDPLVREAVVAALGAIGDLSGFDAVLAGLRDKPPIRRRAVCALAAFEGPEVEEALAIALNDRDWQVRQIAETLMRTALVAPDDATGKP